MQGAIGAALAAPDLAQAEAWLRQALGRFPNDPRILGMAARFEQARGNNQRAADYWRAALAAMPPGSAAEKLDSGFGYPPGSFKAPAPGDLKRLVDPRNDPPQKTDKLPPLPSYLESPSRAPVAPQQNLSVPDNDPLPLPPVSSLILAPTPRNNAQGTRLRITSQPVDSMTAQAQARFAAQTDAQLTQSSAMQIHAIPNAPVNPPGQLNGILSNSAPVGQAQYIDAQYTPSAQDAAAGAYSAPKQPAADPQSQSQQAQCATQPSPCKPTAAKKKAAPRKPARSTSKSTASPRQAKTQTLGTAEPAQPDRQQGQLPATSSSGSSGSQEPVQPAPAQTAPAPEATDTGLTDEELQQRNLPPLRGPWIRLQRAPHPIDPREEAEMQLRSIESGYSAWFGGAGIVNYRSGALGYDHLTALEAPFEFSSPLGFNARFTIVAKPVFLDSGQADGSSLLTVQASSTAGTVLVPIPQPLGTDVSTSIASTGGGGGIPPQQNAAGIGGELQLAFPHLALAGGYTPYGFLVSSYTGRAQWKPGDGPFTFNFVRDSVKDSQLSYSGLRDPAGTTLAHQGQIWGAVMANQGNVQFSHGDAESGFYFGVGGQYLTGYHVQKNIRIDGSGGAYWRLKTFPEYGNLSIGANFFGMHYTHNENAFTLGMGGYFSPQAYFLANVPISWVGHYQTRWHYNVMGSLGVQGFQENAAPLFPLDSGDEIGQTVTVGTTVYNELALPAKTSVGPNYDFRGQVAYQIGPHWFAGGFVSANNSRDYNNVSAGFSLHYMFRSQPSTVAGPTGLFPTGNDSTRANDALRPFRVP
jgi:hypothetical protein